MQSNHSQQLQSRKQHPKKKLSSRLQTLNCLMKEAWQHKQVVQQMQQSQQLSSSKHHATLQQMWHMTDLLQSTMQHALPMTQMTEPVMLLMLASSRPSQRAHCLLLGSLLQQQLVQQVVHHVQMHNLKLVVLNKIC